jgi:hypothetical protein
MVLYNWHKYWLVRTLIKDINPIHEKNNSFHKGYFSPGNTLSGNPENEFA